MSEKVTFQELIESIADQTDNSRQFTHDFLKDFVAVINNGLENDGTISIAGFGKFKLRPMDERGGYNPQTGEKITIPAHNKVVFKPYKDLRELVNAPYTHLEAELLDDETDTKSSDNREKESQKFVPPSSSESEGSGPEPSQETTKEDREKAPWEQALEDTGDDDFAPEYLLNMGNDEEEQAGVQPGDLEEDLDDYDIVEYSPHMETGNIRKRMTGSPSSDADEEIDEQKTKGTNSLNDVRSPETDDKESVSNEQVQLTEAEETEKFDSDEPGQTDPTASFSQQPERRDNKSQNRMWVIAAACILLLLTAGASWYVISSDYSSQETLALNSVPPAVDRQQDDPAPSSGQSDPPVSSSSDAEGSGSADRAAQNRQSQQSTSTSQIITEGQTLWSLADQQYDNPYLWPWIYDENKSSISNPDLIRAGKALDLPLPDGADGDLSTNDSLQVAIGYVETYRWYKNHGYEKAKYYLYVAKIYKGNVFDHTDVNIDDSDLAFANRTR